MKRTAQFAFSITTTLLTVTALVGVVQAQSLPTSAMDKITGGGKVIASAAVTATWLRPSATSLMLTANPATKIIIGKSTTLTITVPPNSSGSVPSGEYVQVYDKTTRQRVGNDVYTGTTNVTKAKTGSESFNVTQKYAKPGSQTFVAELWDKGETHQHHKPSQISSFTTVTWVKPSTTPSPSAKSLTLIASPAASRVGDVVTLNATMSKNIPSSDYVIIQDKTGWYDLGNGQSTTNTTSESTAQTVQYGGAVFVQQARPNPNATRNTHGK